MQQNSVNSLQELDIAADLTYRTLRAAQAALESAAVNSGYDDLEADPHVVACRALASAAQLAHDAAQDRIDEALGTEPTVLLRGGTSPQSRRSLTAWADSRGSGEDLVMAVRVILAALSHGRGVKILITEGE